MIKLVRWRHDSGLSFTNNKEYPVLKENENEYRVLDNYENIVWTKKDNFYSSNECLSNDPINPSHYKTGNIEPIDFIEDQQLDFLLGNAIKYICRAGKKDKDKEVEDLEKAVWYLQRKIKTLKNI